MFLGYISDSVFRYVLGCTLALSTFLMIMTPSAISYKETYGNNNYWIGVFQKENIET